VSVDVFIVKFFDFDEFVVIVGVLVFVGWVG